MAKRKTTHQDTDWAQFTDEEKARAVAVVQRHREKKRRRGPVGRPHQFKLVKHAIEETLKIPGGVSGSDDTPWSQEDWVEKIQAFLKNETPENPVPKKATILKHFKTYIQHTPFPLHLLPASLERIKRLNDQFTRWYAEAVGIAASRASSTKSLRFTLRLPVVDALHRELCAKHIWRARRRKPFTEAERQAWMLNQWNGTHPVPVTSRPPSTSPEMTTRATPVNPRQPRKS
jgi:hypothetical protein